MTCCLFVVTYFKTQHVEGHYRANVGQKKRTDVSWQVKLKTVCIAMFPGAFTKL